MIRPLDAVAIWGGQTLYALWVGRLRHLKGLALSVAGLMLGAALYSAYNRALVGEWFHAPLLMMNYAYRMGFGSDIGVNWETFDTPGHNPWRALINLNFNMAVMSQDLFGWPLSSLFFVIVFWVFGRMSAASPFERGDHGKRGRGVRIVLTTACVSGRASTSVSCLIWWCFQSTVSGACRRSSRNM